jgi:transcriptional regulator with XRE-family HTH domain
MELRRELRARDLGAAELARAAGVSEMTVSRIARGQSEGRPSTRRALRQALADFPVVAAGAGRQSTWPAVLVKRLAWSRLDSYDGAEIGGWLIGRDLGDRMVVEAVYEEQDAVRTSRTISLDLRRAVHLESAQAPGVIVLGSWHGHPPSSRAQASPTDLDAWASSATTLGRSRWLGVVAREPASPGQTELDTAVYVVRPSGEYRWIPSPVRI